MANTGKLKKIMGATPHAEMLIRRLYRNSLINQILYRKVKKKKTITPLKFDFSDVLNHLKSIGVKEGDLLIVHSAYRPLKGSGLSPEGIVDQLLSYVGSTGTLAMPVIRKYPESPQESEALTADISNITFLYDVHHSKVWTGIIPKTLMQKEGAVTSRFPLNTLTALGPLAKEMMENNLKGNLPTPNGINSSWNYCTNQNAWVVSIGTDLTHSLTMIHTAEDVKKYNWPIKNWYREKKFRIVDGDFECEKVVLERHPRWGMLHFGERKLCNDLINDGIMKSTSVNGVLIESLRSKNLFDYLNSRNEKGYPYFWVNKYL